jgi:hypothetical protein
MQKHERAAKRMIEKAGFRVPSDVMLTAQFELASGERPVAGHRGGYVSYAVVCDTAPHDQSD